MQQREVFPAELLELFKDATENNFPFEGAMFGPDDTDYDAYWSMHVAKGVGILKCSLRDVYGNEADFEWDVTPKSR